MAANDVHEKAIANARWPVSLFRLIASDLDGTLLRNDGTISLRSCDAIRAVGRVGMAFVFATARPARDIESIAAAAGVAGLAVCSNGSIVYDIGQRVIRHHVGLSPQIALEVVEALRVALPGLAFAAEYGDAIAYDTRFPELRNEPSMRGSEFDKFLDQRLIKLLVHHHTSDVELLAPLVSSAVGDRLQVNHSGGHLKFLEIASPGISKATGLAKLCSSLGIASDEVVAFGDMPNDLPMLGFAGKSVAVANAHSDVLAAAHEITASNEEDGVARTIEALLYDLRAS